MENGFILLHRSIKSNWVFKDHAAFHVWIKLLMDANYSEVKRRSGGQLEVYERGAVYISKRAFARDCGIGRDRLDNILSALESDSMIRIASRHQGTVITILNYDSYQYQETGHPPPTRSGPVSRPAADPPLINNNNKYTNTPLTPHGGKSDTSIPDHEKPEPEKKKRVRFKPPELAEVCAYFREKGYKPSEAEKMHDFYESKGWMVGKNKMKDWRASSRNWFKGVDASGKLPTTSGDGQGYDYVEHTEGGKKYLVPTVNGAIVYNQNMWREVEA